MYGLRKTVVYDIDLNDCAANFIGAFLMRVFFLAVHRGAAVGTVLSCGHFKIKSVQFPVPGISFFGGRFSVQRASSQNGAQAIACGHRRKTKLRAVITFNDSC